MLRNVLTNFLDAHRKFARPEEFNAVIRILAHYDFSNFCAYVHSVTFSKSAYSRLYNVKWPTLNSASFYC
jgi:hypothetical protein